MMDVAAIRPARAADADAIGALTRRAYRPWIALTGRAPLPMRVDYREAIQVHHFSVLENDGELVGVIETATEGDALVIVNVAVDPGSQSRGVGRQLMAHAEQMARSGGLTRTRLYTNKLFARNLELYASLGYEVEREEVLNGGIAVHMSKQLA